MAETSQEVIRRYLEDAITAEKSFQTQLQSFAGEGDDEEVRAVFLAHADETGRHSERLTARLKELGGSPSAAKGFLAGIFSSTPKTLQAAHQPQERTAQNLMTVFTIESSECAMYEALATVAAAAGDTATETLAREIQAEERQGAEAVWHFIPTRAKIAFNMLTVGETDPAIATRTSDDRVV